MVSALNQITAGSRRRTRVYDTTNLTNLIAYLEEYLVPIGTVIAKFTQTSPGPAWIRIAGQQLSKADYPELYADIGGMFGETSTTFGLPDAANSYLAGAGVAAAGAVFGSNSVALTVDQMPGHGHGITDPGHDHNFTGAAHSHGITDPGHSHGVTDPGHDHGVTDPGHSHDVDEAAASADAGTGGDVASAVAGGATSTETTGITVDSNTTGITVDSDVTGVTVDSATADGTISSDVTGVSIQNTGGGEAFDNRPLSIGVHYFIKARS